MKSLSLTLFALLLVIGFSAQTQKRIALVIGSFIWYDDFASQIEKN